MTNHSEQAFFFSNEIPDLSIDTGRSPISRPKHDGNFGNQRGNDIIWDDSKERQTPDDTFQSATSSKWSRANLTSPHLARPWRHSISDKKGPLPASRTVRQFDAQRQRMRLFANSIFQWLITVLLCGFLAACLGGFDSLLWMSLDKKHAFNALIVLISLFLGNNLSSSLRGYAQMMRWRLLAGRYRSLKEFELVMHCDSLRKVMKLFWVARTRGRFRLNKTQWLCAIWLSINLLLQVLVALLGLTYNLNQSNVPQLDFGLVSICDLSMIRDIWGATIPTYFAELGSANAYGVQGQDYNFVSTLPEGQGKIPAFGTSSTPTIYANDAYTILSYFFQDQNPFNPDITLMTHRSINATASCESFKVISGGDGINPNVTYLSPTGTPISIDVVRVGPGATTYISVLNSTCGPRCTEVMALQSADNDLILEPKFFKCTSTLSPVSGIAGYVQPGQTEWLYQMADPQARIIAGAIGWTGFNYTADDQYQYVRYTLDSWWSPNWPADTGVIERRIMEFAIEGIAAMDGNGPRRNVSGYYPVPAQVVSVQWQWAGAILAVIPFIQLLALICIITWANQAIIKDTSCLSTARLLRPVIDKLGAAGCLLSGEEIAEELSAIKVIYGWRQAEAMEWANEIGADGGVRHVDVLEETEGFGVQGRMPEGRYDGEVSGVEFLRKRRKRRGSI